jgi:hypothetical protein
MGVEPGKVEVSGRAAGGLLFRLCGCMGLAPGLAKGGWLDLGLRKEDGVEWELAGVAVIFRPVAPVSILVRRCFKGCVWCRLDADGRIGSRTGGGVRRLVQALGKGHAGVRRVRIGQWSPILQTPAVLANLLPCLIQSLYRLAPSRATRARRC